MSQGDIPAVASLSCGCRLVSRDFTYVPVRIAETDEWLRISTLQFVMRAINPLPLAKSKLMAWTMQEEKGHISNLMFRA